MRRLIHILSRVLLVVVPLGLGVALVASAVVQREPLEPGEPEAPPLSVRVVTLEASDPVPRVTAHGSVQPSAAWRGVAQVAAEVAWLYPGLQPGHLVEAEEVIVRLDPTEGREIRKTRPCLVISPDEMNRHIETVLVAPMTTKGRPYPTRVPVRFGRKKGQIALDQIRTIDKQRLIKRMGKIDQATADSVLSVLAEMFAP
jgi:mRNA interferase MazF